MSKTQQYTIDRPIGFDIPERKPPVPWNKFCYNSAEGTVLGRSGLSWAKIGIFYTVFYGVLAALVAICMWVFFQTLDPRIPKWQLSESIIGQNPGLGYRPLPPDDNVESTLIWYRGVQPKDYQVWTDALKKFVKPYETPGLIKAAGNDLVKCNYDTVRKPNEVCNVDVSSDDMKPCISSSDFNYHLSSPCVFLKLNKIYGWVPEYINTTENLPDNMPKDLVDYLRNDSKLLLNPKNRNTVWVSCEGENPADIEHIGPIKYLPQRGFPGYYYPYENAEGYLSPIVAINFERPRRGVLINIECKAWAHNIKHDRRDRIGSVHFELMID